MLATGQTTVCSWESALVVPWWWPGATTLPAMVATVWHTFAVFVNTLKEHNMRATILIIVGLVMAMAGVGGVDVSPDLMTMVQSTVISIVGVVLMWIGTSWISEQTELTVIELRHDNMKTRRRQHQNS
jgi:uncharacterized membrane protein